MARRHLDIAAFARAMTVPPSSNLFGTARLTRFTHAHTLTEPSVGIEARDYGAHWWLKHDDRVTFAVTGYGGQHLRLVPSTDLVIVRLGESTQGQRDTLLAAGDAVATAFD